MFSDLLAPAVLLLLLLLLLFTWVVWYTISSDTYAALPFVFVGRVPTNASLAKTALHQAGPPTWCSRDV